MYFLRDISVYRHRSCKCWYLVVLSMTVCMRVSMGCTMKGMTPSPMPVVAHFLLVSATCGSVLARPTSEKAQMRLMVKPGLSHGVMLNSSTSLLPK